MLNVHEGELAAVLQQRIPGMDPAFAAIRAQDLIADTDQRLEQNLQQWMEGKALSDDWVGKYCINAILAIRGDRDFLSALEAMNLYLQNPRMGELRIWRARR